MSHTQYWVWVPPMLVYKCASRSMCIKWPSCHADHQEVSRCHTRGASEESIPCRLQCMQMREPPWLWNPEQISPEVQNRGISRPTKKDWCHPKILCARFAGFYFAKFCRAPDVLENVLDSFSSFYTKIVYKPHFLWCLNTQLSGVQPKNVEK